MCRLLSAQRGCVGEQEGVRMRDSKRMRKNLSKMLLNRPCRVTRVTSCPCRFFLSWRWREGEGGEVYVWSAAACTETVMSPQYPRFLGIWHWLVVLFCLIRGHFSWLQLDRRVLEHEFPKKSGPIVLYFCVRWVFFFINLPFTYHELWLDSVLIILLLCWSNILS